MYVYFRYIPHISSKKESLGTIAGIYTRGVQHTAHGPESGPLLGVSIRAARPTDTEHDKYSELVARLIVDFQDFRKHTDIIKLLSDPFQVDPTVKYQM